MIYIALYRGKSWFPSQCVEWITWSKYSHAALVRQVDGTQSILEAWSPGGVQETSKFRELHQKDTRVDLFRYVTPLDTTEELGIWHAARSQLGKPYDFGGVVSFLVRRRLQRPGAWFCSELVTWACRQGGRPVLNQPDWKNSPGDITKSPALVYDSFARA